MRARQSAVRLYDGDLIYYYYYNFGTKCFLIRITLIIFKFDVIHYSIKRRLF